MQSGANSAGQPERHAYKTLLATCAVLMIAGCGPLRVHVQPEAPSRFGETAGRKGKVDLFVAPEVAQLVHRSQVAAGMGGKIECDFALGAALHKTIEASVRALYPEAVPVEQCTCAASPSLICVRLAKAPEIQIRWVQHLMTVGGGSTVSLAARVETQRCDTRRTWTAVVTGYGSADRHEALANYPDAQEFAPAVDTALSDLSSNLDRLLMTIDLTMADSTDPTASVEGRNDAPVQ